MIRLRQALSVILFLLAGCLSGGLSAQQAGLLLGYDGRAADDSAGPGRDASLHTMLILFSPDQARLVATVPDIILPRTDGFWRIGRTSICEYQPPPTADDTSGTDNIRDTLWQVPLDSVPVLTQSARCRGHSPDDESGGGEPMLCNLWRGRYLFASPGMYSQEFEYSQTEDCEARGGHQTYRSQVRLFSTERSVNLADLYAARAAPAYADASRAGFVELSKETNCPEPDDEPDLDSWLIVHEHGDWRPVAALYSSVGDCAFRQDLNLSLPAALIGEKAIPNAWTGFATAIPQLGDYYLSPRQDYALVTTMVPGSVHMYAYSVKAGLPDRKLAEIGWSPDGSPGPTIIMAQWVLGGHVASWTDVMLRITRSHLPKPRVLVSSH